MSTYEWQIAIWVNNPVSQSWIDAINRNNPTDNDHPGWLAWLKHL